MEKRLKKAYQKPQIREVNLVPQEAVLGNCKSASTGASKGSATNCRNAGCKTIAS